MQLLNRRPGEVKLETILSKEGVKQENSLSMVIFGISLSVMTEKIRGEYPVLLQSWYADGFITEGSSAHIKPAISVIEALGTSHILFLNPDKQKFVQYPGVS